ncbi:MAG: hypothetical protein IJY46_05125 [Lentisphaeria bacterium]|nr:hypothetical protein [Lentisphaeria bacterium]
MLDYDSMVVPPFPSGEPRFMDMLRNAPDFRPHWDMSVVPGADDADFRGGFDVKFNFPDPEKLLETAVDDLCGILQEAGVKKSGANAIEIRKCDDLSGESYRIIVEKAAIIIEAGGTEGIRRGIYYVEELLVNSRAPIFKVGVTERKPWLKNRISRCFFGPIKRPPFNRDELMDDIDYYPEAYLNRLAREGVNGLWLTIVFREICNNSFYPRCPDAEKRIAKLRKTVERCRRYGIKIWTFAIEPRAWIHVNPLPEGFPELAGPETYAGNTFCPKSDAAKKYLYECTNSLFSSVPHLGGLMLISHGERPTSCLSSVSYFSDDSRPCKDKCDLSVSDILSSVLTPMEQGMHDANPDAELISWLYMPYVPQGGSWIYELPEKLTEKVILAFNFESGCNKMQLGKVRSGGDYWLSCVGPSDRFGRIAAAARGKCEMAAKLQVCCSHEMATIPFVPVPGLLYRKYREMYKLGVKHAVQCWYFGNYPGLMNRAAARLAFEDFSRSEDEFLKELAFSEWGEKNAETIANVWKHFAESYSNYPLDIQFQYYGPMHDGAVWPLHLQLSRKAMTRSWKPDAFPAGDAIGESMFNHTLAENTILTRLMAKEWAKGMELYRTVKDEYLDQPERCLDGTLYEALNIHMTSGANVMEFYSLRNALLDSPANPTPTLDRIEEIFHEEIANSRKLAEICEQDARLGYHSEAEVYKYFPEKLRWRADVLEKLLSGTFAECRKYAAEGRPLGELLGEQGEWHKCGVTYDNGDVKWKAEKVGAMLEFEVQCKRQPGAKEERFCFYLADSKGEIAPWNFTVGGLHSFDMRKAAIIDSVKEDGVWKIKASMAHGLIGGGDTFCFGCQYVWEDDEHTNHMTGYPAGNFVHEQRLNIGIYTPDRTVPVKI